MDVLKNKPAGKCDCPNEVIILRADGLYSFHV